MKHLSQRDPNWSNITMVPSRLTLGRYGCTTTCIAMLSDYFKCYTSPDHVVNVNVKYTIDGLILWESIKFPNFAFEDRIYGYLPGRIDQSLADPNRAVILQVANASHWVVAIHKVPGTKLYFIVDPWDGKVKLSSTYGKITGSAHFKRTSF